MPPLLIANWKMNPRTSNRAIALFRSYGAKKQAKATLVVCPPAPFIPALQSMRKKHGILRKIFLGGQDSGPAIEGAFTGEVSPAMLKDAGASYVIIGHSERRAQGQTDELINKKVKSAIASKLNVILCVGETERVQDGAEFNVVKQQVVAALEGVPKAHLKRVSICYEPVWAIGNGNPASPAEAIEVGLFIMRTIAGVLGKHPRTRMRVLYGGSVTSENAHEYLEHEVLSGFLVGGASLSGKSFLGILHAITK